MTSNVRVQVQLIIRVNIIILCDSRQRVPAFFEASPHLGGDGHKREFSAVGSSSSPPHARIVEPGWHTMSTIIDWPLGHRCCVSVMREATALALCE